MLGTTLGDSYRRKLGSDELSDMVYSYGDFDVTLGISEETKYDTRLCKMGGIVHVCNEDFKIGFYDGKIMGDTLGDADKLKLWVN